MKYSFLNQIVFNLIIFLFGSLAMADSFGTGANQFTIDFVPISDTTNPTHGINPGNGFNFVGVNNDYRMGTYEITNDQWNKFTASSGIPKGYPQAAYDDNMPYYMGANVPVGDVSWYEAAQFVNWLNTSTGHHAAYKFTGISGTDNYAFDIWNADEAANGTNLYRHKDSFYFLPTEDEWVKAAYWDDGTLKNYATKGADTLFQGNGTNGGWNYRVEGDIGPFGPSEGLWNVGSGSEELNGTYDMMGNAWEWMESPFDDPHFSTGARRGGRGGCCGNDANALHALTRDIGNYYATDESYLQGFRVASVPEPGGIVILNMGIIGWIAYARRRKHKRP